MSQEVFDGGFAAATDNIQANAGQPTAYQHHAEDDTLCYQLQLTVGAASAVYVALRELNLDRLNVNRIPRCNLNGPEQPAGH